MQEDAEGRPAEGRSKPIPAGQARQGVTGHNVRYVLGWGLAGVVIAFVVVYLVLR